MPTDPLRLAALATIAIGEIDSDSPTWQRDMERVIARAHTAAWLAGTAERLGVKLDSALLSQARLSRAERAEIKAVVEKQLEYLQGFAEAKGSLSEAQIAARAAMYAGAVRGTFLETRWGDWDIAPELYPGAQQCLTNCRCKAHVVDNGDGTGTWVRELGSERSCEECPPLAGEHPIERRRAV